MIIGISDYSRLTKLTNPTFDAEAVRARLRDTGYKTKLILNGDATRINLIREWEAFLHEIEKGDEVVVYFSGHGIDVNGQNFIVPQDSPSADQIVTTAVLKAHLIPIVPWMTDLDDREVTANIWILDACRENPLTVRGKALGERGGLNTNDETRLGSFVFYSAYTRETSRDTIEADRGEKKGSIFTRVFLSKFDEFKRKPVWDFGQAIKKPVIDLAKPHPQHPVHVNSLTDPWCFDRCDAQAVDVKLQTVTKTVMNATDSDLKKLSSAQQGATVPNAVFLGKKSQSGMCEQSKIDSFPFGCELLKSLVKNASKQKIIGIPLTPQTTINVRKRAPTIDEKSGADYACVVDTLNPKQHVVISGVLEVAYSGDVFYWGTVDQAAKDCLPEFESKKLRAAGSVSVGGRYDPSAPTKKSSEFCVVIDNENGVLDPSSAKFVATLRTDPSRARYEIFLSDNRRICVRLSVTTKEIRLLEEIRGDIEVTQKIPRKSIRSEFETTILSSKIVSISTGGTYDPSMPRTRSTEFCLEKTKDAATLDPSSIKFISTSRSDNDQTEYEIFIQNNDEACVRLTARTKEPEFVRQEISGYLQVVQLSPRSM